MFSVDVCFREIDKSWDEDILKYKIDIYHLSGWMKSSMIIDEGKPKGIVASYGDKKIFFPVLIRELDNDFWDATSTYGYGGPVVDSSLSNEEIAIIMPEVINFLYKQGCVSWFIRLHPILNAQWSVEIGTIIEHGPTLVSDLTKTAEEHWSQTQRQHRQGIKKAIKAGVTTMIESIAEDKVQLFLKIYIETMNTVNADQYYYFNEEYFYALLANLPDRLWLITAYWEGVAISSAICTTCKESGIIQFHLCGTLNDFRYLQPSKLITHEIRKWGRELGYDYLHLGGGVGAKRDSLYNYKKGFSSAELTFKTQRIIVDPMKYEQLVYDLGKDNIDSDFFPNYRQRS